MAKGAGAWAERIQFGFLKYKILASSSAKMEPAWLQSPGAHGPKGPSWQPLRYVPTTTVLLEVSSHLFKGKLTTLISIEGTMTIANMRIDRAT